MLARGARRPAGAPEDRERPLRAARAASRRLSICPAPGCGCTTWNGSRVRDVGLGREHVLGQREHDRAGPSGAGRRERPRHVLRDAIGAVDLRDPLRQRAEHPPEVDLLERLALLLVGGDLADEQDQRRRVLERGVHADRRLRRPGPARDDGDARPAGELPVGVGHVRGAGLVAARDQPDRGVVEAVEHREEALARDAEDRVRPVHGELVDEELAAVATHSWLFEIDAGALQLRLVLVGGIDVRDRPLARPLGRQHQHAHERRRLRLGGGREDGIGAGLVPPLERAVLVRLALRVDADPSLEQHAQARARVGVAVGDAARREVDAVAADHRRPGRARGQRPDERVPFDLRRPEVGLVALDVVDDAIAVLGRDAVGVLGQAEDQWNVWPPSITIVWPVTKSEPGPQK